MLQQLVKAAGAPTLVPMAWAAVSSSVASSIPAVTLAFARTEGISARSSLMHAARFPGLAGYATTAAAGDVNPAASVDTHAAATAPNVNVNVPQPKDASFDSGYIAAHPGMKQAPAGVAVHLAADPDVRAAMKNPVYPKEYLESVHYKHITPVKLHQKLAFRTIQVIRSTFDLATGYNAEKMTEAKWLQRMIFLETVAGVPGMVGGMLRHLRSLRRMQRDMGWINTLLEEAENERMHLLTFLEIRKPGLLFRSNVILAQGIMFNMFFLAYLVSPKFCHSLVGYLEEEAVKTYTQALKDIDAGKLWPNRPAPDIAKSYWWLGDDATMRDLILAVRADEACHSHVNHTLGKLQANDTNPFLGKDSHMVP